MLMVNSCWIEPAKHCDMVVQLHGIHSTVECDYCIDVCSHTIHNVSIEAALRVIQRDVASAISQGCRLLGSIRCDVWWCWWSNRIQIVGICQFATSSQRVLLWTRVEVASDVHRWQLQHRHVGQVVRRRSHTITCRRCQCDIRRAATADDDNE